MFEEKKNKEYIRYPDKNLTIRTKKDKDDCWIVWVAIDNKNVAFTMIMYDFVYWYENELNLHIEIDSSLEGQKGFRIHEDISIIVQEIKRFIELFNITASEALPQFPKEE